VQGVPEQFTDERDSARFRHLAQLPGLELYHAHISDYAFEPHTHEAFGIGTIETGAERFRYRGTQHLAAEKSVVTMNPDEIHTGESATEGGWRYRMVYIEPDLLEEVTGLRHWWFSDVTRHDPLRSQQIGQLIYGLWHTDDPLAQKGLLLDLIETFQPLARHAPVAREGRAHPGRAGERRFAQSVPFPAPVQSPFPRYATPDADGDSPVARKGVSHSRHACRRSRRRNGADRSVSPDPRLYPPLRHYARALPEAGFAALMRNLIQYARICASYTGYNMYYCGRKDD